MMTARVITAARLRGVSRAIIILIIIIVLILTIQWLIVRTPVIVARWRIRSIRSVVGVVLSFLADLFALSSFHPSFFQQSTLLGQTLAFLTILDLILPNESYWRRAKDVLVLTELANPRRIGWIVEVLVFLFDSTFASSIGVQLRGASAWLSRWLYLLVWRTTRGRGISRLAAGAVHAGTCLGALIINGGVVRANRRSCAGAARGWGCSRRCGIRAGRLRVDIFLEGPDHVLRRVGATSEGELGLVRARLGGLLLEQAYVLVAGVRWRCLCVGDGG